MCGKQNRVIGKVVACVALATSCFSSLGVAQSTAPAITTIAGTPLTIYVGDDASFQVENSNVPGNSTGAGQFYPHYSADPTISGVALSTADFGWFVSTVTTGSGSSPTLYTPDFLDHPTGSATGFANPATVYSARSVSPVSGSGTRADPFIVTVNSTAGVLSTNLVVSYVNGDAYFSKSFSVSNAGTTDQDVNVFLGGDIYLANDDHGIPAQGPAGSIGGVTCTGTNYNILLVPEMPPDNHDEADSFAAIWSSIGSLLLSDTVNNTSGCIDNGAALQWTASLVAGGTIQITAATSFGAIPPITQFNVLAVAPAVGNPGDSVPVTISGLGFMSGTTFDFGPDISICSCSLVIAADGASATATLSIAPTAAPGPRNIVATQSAGGLTATLVNGFAVNAPPVDVGLTAADAFLLDTTTVATFEVANTSSNTAANVVVWATPDANSSVSLGAFLQCTSGTVICSDPAVAVDCSGDTCTIASLPAGQSIEMFGLLDATSGSSLPTASVTVTAPGDTNSANDTITLTGGTN